jgi:DNA-binding GntR family transcriptional regulator
VSRTPVREALQRLVASGLADRQGKRTLIVREFSTKEIEDLYFVRLHLETAAAELAAQRAAGGAAELRRLVEEMAAAVETGDDARYHKAHRTFHESIARIGENAFLSHFIPSVLDVADAVWAGTLPGSVRYQEADRGHREIQSAIAQGDAHLARDAMAKHLTNSLELILQHLSATPESPTPTLRALMRDVLSARTPVSG